MKTIVIYNSQTGFTRQYARWIAEATGADCMELSAAKKKDLSGYEAIIFGGHACGGRISKLSWFKNRIRQWENQKLIVFCVGASPIDNPEIEPALRKNFKASESEKISVFYCPGGLNYEKMPAFSKLMMRLFVKALKRKKEKTPAGQEMIRMLSASYDISERKYIDPILSCLNK